MIEKTALFLAGFIPSLLTTINSYTSYISSFFDREPAADATRSIPEIIESRGFRSETYQVTTSDGYILTLFRIVNPFMKKNNIKTYPVLLAHGAVCDAGQWLINSDDGHLAPTRQESPNDKKNDKRPKQKMTNNLGFLLANEGYDVWLLNFRGSKYSRAHKKLTAKDGKFWDFSNDEIIQQDLPACLDFVLSKTGHPQIGYIGHSLGSIAMFGLLSHQPDYNSKIKPFIAMSPAVTMSRVFQELVIPVVKVTIPIPRFLVTPVLRAADMILQASGPGELRIFHLTSKVISYVASGNMFQYHLSRGLQRLLSLFYVHSDLDPNRLSVFASQMHFWMSKKQLSHFMQQIIYNEFSRYDYGEEKNKIAYGDADPPLYDLREVTNQTIAMIYSKTDAVHSPGDVENVISHLKVPVIGDFRVKDPNFSHLDFVFCSKLGILVNPEILKILRKVKAVPDHVAANGTTSAAATSTMV